ncbi:uncharacterized protein LOC135399568 [Ornithodoros turicata]|uniref:uncharacterized protein LOC135399568 n=1 Tax=Ornithodoros turicata TaxID=34597 RepID=UPI0031396512
MNWGAMDSGEHGDGQDAAHTYHPIRTDAYVEFIDAGTGRELSNDASSPSSGSAAPEAANPVLSGNKPGRIPRPPNAFMIFAQEFRRPTAIRHPEENNKKISTRLGHMWRAMSDIEKEGYHRKAKMAVVEHKRKYPNYVYNPREARQRRAEERKAKLMANQLRKCVGGCTANSTEMTLDTSTTRMAPVSTSMDASRQSPLVESVWSQIRPTNSSNQQRNSSSNELFRVHPSPSSSSCTTQELPAIMAKQHRPKMRLPGLPSTVSSYPMKFYKQSSSWPVQQPMERHPPVYQQMTLFRANQQPGRHTPLVGQGQRIYNDCSSRMYRLEESRPQDFEEQPMGADFHSDDWDQQFHAQHRVSPVNPLRHAGLVPSGVAIVQGAPTETAFSVIPQAKRSSQGMLCSPRPIIQSHAVRIWPPEPQGYSCFSQPALKYSVYSGCCSLAVPLAVSRVPHNAHATSDAIYNHIPRPSCSASREMPSNAVRRLLSPTRQTVCHDHLFEPTVSCPRVSPYPQISVTSGVDGDQIHARRAPTNGGPGRGSVDTTQDVEKEERMVAATSTSDYMPFKKSIINRELNGSSPISVAATKLF